MKFLLWALFGNDDDGIFGTPDFHPTWPLWLRAVLWWFRNPFHNLTFYVIGISVSSPSGKGVLPDTAHRWGDYPQDVFNPNGGWNKCYTYYDGIVYLFRSYIGWWKFYIGWRERGNFGFRLTLNGSKILSAVKSLIKRS